MIQRMANKTKHWGNDLLPLLTSQTEDFRKRQEQKVTLIEFQFENTKANNQKYLTLEN